MVQRPYVTKPGFYRTKLLPGEVDREDVEEEAQSLLTDQRDTITCVFVWSASEQQFVGSYKKEGHIS